MFVIDTENKWMVTRGEGVWEVSKRDEEGQLYGEWLVTRLLEVITLKSIQMLNYVVYLKLI